MGITADRYEDMRISLRDGGGDPGESAGGASAPPKIGIRGSRIYEPTRISPEWRRRLHESFGKEPLQLIFSPTACVKAKEAISWSRKEKKNTVEQGGILLGQAFRYRDEIFCFVEDIILAETRGERTAVEFSPEMWAAMREEVELLDWSRGACPPLRILGWFHTHPNDLEVFMSKTDRDTQKKHFPKDWQVSLVINPHRKRYKVYFGRDIREGSVKGWDGNCDMQDMLDGLRAPFQ